MQFTIDENGSITTPNGYQAAALCAGLKKNKLDLTVIKSDCIASAAAVFTTNSLKAAPILISQTSLHNGQAQAVVINSGIANAFTGKRGLEDGKEMASVTAAQLGIEPGDVLVASTGVIGEYLPMSRLRQGISTACRQLSSQNGLKAARAIMTTDSRPKHAAVEFTLNGSVCKIGAISKGSGMIQPNMATMLSVLTSDVDIKPDLLQQALRRAVAISYNRLTVDGEMSTNDCVFFLANGSAHHATIQDKNRDYERFCQALQKLCLHQTQKLAADGEGATKSIIVTIERAKTEKEAEKAARAVANSMLVKTAVYGEDPNWGRVISAIGSSGVALNKEVLTVWFGDIAVAVNGAAVSFDTEKMKTVVKHSKIEIRARLGSGKEKATIYTCDLTHKYIDINAEYHT